jgi:hypothetical protein
MLSLSEGSGPIQGGGHFRKNQNKSAQKAFTQSIVERALMSNHPIYLNALKVMKMRQSIREIVGFWRMKRTRLMTLMIRVSLP